MTGKQEAASSRDEAASIALAYDVEVAAVAGGVRDQ
jgi:hypothetical protein